MENKNSGNGFLLGMIVGGAIVFLLGTDKGRAILKSLTDEGISGLSDILENVEEEEYYEEESKEAPKREKPAGERIMKSEDTIATRPASKRRFFRRSK